jgi:hypothetical protein
VIGPARRLAVTRFTHEFLPDVALTEDQTDRILADMSSVLRTFDGGADIACNVAYCRSGRLRDVSVGDGAIDTANELNEVFQVPGDVKVVREINFCDSEFKPDTIGCARGQSFIVQRVGINEGGLWAHEFGHTVDLAHPKPEIRPQ